LTSRGHHQQLIRPLGSLYLLGVPKKLRFRPAQAVSIRLTTPLLRVISRQDTIHTKQLPSPLPGLLRIFPQPPTPPFWHHTEKKKVVDRSFDFHPTCAPIANTYHIQTGVHPPISLLHRRRLVSHALSVRRTVIATPLDSYLLLPHVQTFPRLHRSFQYTWKRLSPIHQSTSLSTCLLTWATQHTSTTSRTLHRQSIGPLGATIIDHPPPIFIHLPPLLGHQQVQPQGDAKHVPL
jgi:hypothetical protein